MIETEVRIWTRLRGRQIGGWKFRRQHPIGPYFVDFYCPAARLVIEFNGLSHDDENQWHYDQRRQAWLELRGFRVLNLGFYDEEVQVDNLLDAICAKLAQLEADGLTVRPLRRTARGGVPSGGFAATSP